jgi:hypothetical protein
VVASSGSSLPRLWIAGAKQQPLQMLRLVTGHKGPLQMLRDRFEGFTWWVVDGRNHGLHYKKIPWTTLKGWRKFWWHWNDELIFSYNNIDNVEARSEQTRDKIK